MPRNSPSASRFPSAAAPRGALWKIRTKQELRQPPNKEINLICSLSSCFPRMIERDRVFDVTGIRQPGAERPQFDLLALGAVLGGAWPLHWWHRLRRCGILGFHHQA